ncbi:MAG: 30S ribosomal protein S17 [Gemmatimonadota bacterium]
MADETKEQEARADRKTRVGKVVSSKMDKTIIVAVERKVSHRLYGKQMTRTKKLYAHDQENAAREGDVVRIMETRPLSKLKRWRVVEIVEKAK